jgi:hypothetical protein
MGGFGSGKWSDVYRRKTSVELCNEMCIKLLRENGFLDESKAGFIEWRNNAGDVVNRVDVESFINVDADKTSYLVVRIGVLSSAIEQRIELIRWPCNYGKFRYYFACPAVKNGVYCGNRAEKLYLPPAAKVFGCRDCYDLTYLSCQESHKYDKISKHIENVDMDALSLMQALRLSCL